MKTLNYLSMGLAFGFVFTTFFSTLFIGLNVFTMQLIAWLIACAIYGVSSMIFEVKNLKLLHATLIHFLIYLSVTGINMYIFYREYLASVIISFVLTYIILYIIMWFSEKRKIREINNKLKQKK